MNTILPATKIMTGLSIDQAADALRSAGYRATVSAQDGRPMIQSAVQGLGFIVTPGNRASDDANHFVDCSFTCLLRFEGTLVDTHVARWNETKRFARLYLTGQMLVLTMDAFIGAGDADLSVRSHCELWDRVIQEFIGFVRALPAGSATPASAAA